MKNMKLKAGEPVSVVLMTIISWLSFLATISTAQDYNYDYEYNYEYDPDYDHGYDFFYLVLQWPPAICNQPNSYCQHPIQFFFTIHGMWPQQINGYSPQGCPDGQDFDVRSMLQDVSGSGLVNWLEIMWPNLKSTGKDPNNRFWVYEWNKHGTCSAWPMQRYFITVLNQATNADVLGKLQSARIEPHNYRRYDINNIRSAFGAWNPRISCSSSRNHGAQQIKEIWLCVNKDGSDIIPCPAGSQFPPSQNCGSGPNPTVVFAA